MLRAMLTLKIKPGREQDVEQFWKNSIEYLNTWPGFTRQYFMRHVDDPSIIVLSSDWKSKEDFNEFFRVIHQKGLTKPLHDMREESEVVVYEMLHDWASQSNTDH